MLLLDLNAYNHENTINFVARNLTYFNRLDCALLITNTSIMRMLGFVECLGSIVLLANGLIMGVDGFIDHLGGPR
jgi:hypothetical protein